MNLPANWQPKLASLIVALAAWIEFEPQLFPHWVQSLAHFLTIAGFGIFGFTTKQWNVTGGTTLNTKNDPTVSGTPKATAAGAPRQP